MRGGRAADASATGTRRSASSRASTAPRPRSCPRASSSSAAATRAERDADAVSTLRPPHHGADDDPRSRPGTCTSSARRSRSSSTRGRHARGPARHPALGLPLAERVRARAAGARRAPATSSASPAATTSTSGTRGEPGVPKTPRYILWGEGTTDEMCLGILQVTRGRLASAHDAGVSSTRRINFRATERLDARERSMSIDSPSGRCEAPARDPG